MNKLKNKLISQFKDTIADKILDKFNGKDSISRKDIQANAWLLPLMDLGQMDLILSNLENWDDDQLNDYPEICKALENNQNVSEIFWNNLDNHYQIDDDDIGAEELDRIFQDVCQDLI